MGDDPHAREPPRRRLLRNCSVVTCLHLLRGARLRGLRRRRPARPDQLRAVCLVLIPRPVEPQGPGHAARPA